MARRKYGEGTVFQRKDGRWVAQIRLDNGKQKQRYCKTEKEANAALRKMLHEKEQGMLATGPSQTLKTYLGQWLEQVHKTRVRKGSYNLYKIMLNKHIIPALGHIQLQRLTAQHVQAFYTHELESGLAAKTVRGYHALLHTALKNAVKWNLIARNVCDLVSPPIPQRHEMQTLTSEQAQRLLEVTQEHGLNVLLTVAITTGMRKGELFGLHWQDIDFEEGCLYVRRTIARIGTFGIVESEPKTQRSRRKIILPAFVLDALKQHQVYQQTLPEKAGTHWQEKGIVFCNGYGGYLEVARFHRMFKQLLESAELPNIRFHDLRHSAATILFRMGIHPKVVQELLGHSNIGITMDTYSHMLPTMQQEAMNKLDNLFRKQSGQVD